MLSDAPRLHYNVGVGCFPSRGDTIPQRCVYPHRAFSMQVRAVIRLPRYSALGPQAMPIHTDYANRYSHDAGATALALEQTPGHIYSLYQTPLLGSNSSYSHDSATFYPSPQVYPGIEYRSTPSSTGMAAHAHGASTLPHPSAPLSARERYTSSTPAFKRSAHQQSRSPTHCGTTARRHDMSSLNSYPAANVGSLNNRSDRLGGANGSQPSATPPLSELHTLGTIVADGVNITPDIHGSIDKGFFLSDHDWTCYRRNYFSTVCSFSLNPLPQTADIHFHPAKSPSEKYRIYGWAMSISAIVAENPTQAIELVQHTPKRDKGPTHKPEKVHMQPKVPTHHHHALTMYPDAGLRNTYTDAYGTAVQPSNPVTEHSFERIQFKQATQNNGKRRAAQQYYHLVIELYADVGTRAKDSLIKVAYRRSAQMIVRGRSPGHYSTDRRGSQSSGANNQNLGSYQVLTEYAPNNMLVTPASFTATYDARTQIHNGIRHNEVPAEQTLTSDEEKAIDSAQRYMYFPDSSLNATHSDRVDVLSSRNENDGTADRMHLGGDHKLKPDYGFGSLTRQYNPQAPTLPADRHRCGPFDGKPTSSGYYPNMLGQTGVTFSGMV
ncbi:NDT80 / phoG like DNA-binding family protein [Sarocladium implicatum]|nr:NDT80 / phoG like DNA-binding family protein [Sarocladium implicatum]